MLKYPFSDRILGQKNIGYRGGLIVKVLQLLMYLTITLALYKTSRGKWRYSFKTSYICSWPFYFLNRTFTHG